MMTQDLLEFGDTLGHRSPEPQPDEALDSAFRLSSEPVGPSADPNQMEFDPAVFGRKP